MRQPVVLFWMAGTDERRAMLESQSCAVGMRVVRCSMRELGANVIAASACGPVLAVVDDDRAATEALGAGVDEVVRQSELTVDGIQQAVTRAEARARGRLHTLAPGRPPPDETGVLAVLLDWIAVELAGCVSGAVLDSELLDQGVRKLIASNPVSGAPGAASGQKTASRRAIESGSGAGSDDVVEMLETVQGSIRQTLEVLNALRGLSGADSTGASVSRVLGALARVLRSRAVPFADIRVEANEPCDTTVPTSKLVAALVVLVSNVLERAARAQTGRAQITLRAFMAEGSAFLEIEDDVAEGAHSEGGTRRSEAIARIASTLRALGGEILVEAGGGGTTTRLVLPVAESVVLGVEDQRATPAFSSRANSAN